MRGHPGQVSSMNNWGSLYCMYTDSLSLRRHWWKVSRLHKYPLFPLRSMRNWCLRSRTMLKAQSCVTDWPFSRPPPLRFVFILTISLGMKAQGRKNNLRFRELHIQLQGLTARMCCSLFAPAIRAPSPFELADPYDPPPLSRHAVESFSTS